MNVVRRCIIGGPDREAGAFINKDLTKPILENTVWEIYGNGCLVFVLLVV